MSLLKLDNFTEAILGKYESTTLNEGLTDCGFMSNFNEDFFTEEKVVETKPLNESFSGSLNECSVFSLDDMNESCKKLNETAVVAPSYELEDVNRLIEDAKTALEEKNMDDMYLMGHTIYMFLEDYANELNDIIVDELDKLQNELEAEAQKLDESCNKKNLKEGFSDDLFVKAVDIVVDFIHDNFDSIPDAKEIEAQLKENMGEFNGLIGDQAEIVDVAATYFDLPSIIDAALDVIGESLEESKEDKSDLDEQVEDIYFYSNSEFKDDLAWLADDLTHYFFKEMESAHWGLSKEDITNIFHGALDDVLQKMRESDECTLFESKEALEEDAATARPNLMKILDAIDNGYIDYQMVAEELLRWIPDDELVDFINMYLDEEAEEFKSLNEAKDDKVTIAVDFFPEDDDDFKEFKKDMAKYCPTLKLKYYSSAAYNQLKVTGPKKDVLNWLVADEDDFGGCGYGGEGGTVGIEANRDWLEEFYPELLENLSESCNKKELNESLRDSLYDKTVEMYEDIISEYWGPDGMNYIPDAKEVLEYCRDHYTSEDLDLLDVAEDLFDLDYVIEDSIENLKEKEFFGNLEESVEEIKPTHRGRKLHSEE